MAHSEDFIAHTTVQEVFDAIWFGEKGLKVNRIQILEKIEWFTLG